MDSGKKKLNKNNNITKKYASGSILFTPAMPTLSVAAFVERGHGLVGRPGLYLHEVGSLVAARLTRNLGRVDVLPGRGSAQHIIDLLELAVLSVRYLLAYVVYERTCVACESVAVRALLHYQDIAAIRAKIEHFFLIVTFL
jgi:hypothetical protein